MRIRRLSSPTSECVRGRERNRRRSRARGRRRRCSPIRPERRISVTCFRKRHDPRIRNHLPALRHRESGNNAHRRLSVFLCVHRLRYEAPAEAGRLLRLLFLRIGALSPNSGRAVGPERCSRLLHEITPWQPSRPPSSRDWLANTRTNLMAWSRLAASALLS